jgi:L-seryl-tRNA(Ser) seleniumtransferase
MNRGDGQEPHEALLRRLPSVNALLAAPELAALEAALSHEARVALIRETLAEVRRAVRAGKLGAAEIAPAALAQRIGQAAAELVRPPLRRVLNATGILIHTNLGRAPLSAGAQAAIARVAAGYSNLEMDLASGKRTSRLAEVRALLCRVTGAEDALAVNNNAAAVFLVLQALAAGREVIVSRGELVEIGGSFRLPDIMAASGAVLREVGTTNRTRLEDYAAALGERSALILKVHPSNFVVRGFTEAAPREALAALAHERGIPLVEDLGSGALAQHPEALLQREPRLQEALAQGVDLVTCSGDKLLGGPQAGLIFGRADWVARLGRHPMARIVRLDKLHLVALQATLLEYLRGADGLDRLPLYRMMRRPLAELEAAAARMIAALEDRGLPGIEVGTTATESAAGGGSLPDEVQPSIAVTLRLKKGSLEAFARALRLGEPALVGRLEQDRLVLDLRTLHEDEWELLPGLLAERWDALRESAKER